jgi:hypothetical protein
LCGGRHPRLLTHRDLLRIPPQPGARVRGPASHVLVISAPGPAWRQALAWAGPARSDGVPKRWRGEGASRPRARARSTASWRRWTSSLAYRWRICVVTVCTDTNSSPAISCAPRPVGRYLAPPPAPWARGGVSSPDVGGPEPADPWCLCCVPSFQPNGRELAGQRRSGSAIRAAVSAAAPGTAGHGPETIAITPLPSGVGHPPR